MAKTGGAHGACFINKNHEIIIREDVSWHVSIDKIIGAAADKKLDFKDFYIIFTCKMPADVLIKIARVGIPLIASNAAPTSSGCTVDNESNIIMVGFVKKIGLIFIHTLIV